MVGKLLFVRAKGKQLSERVGQWVSLRFGLARVLTVHRTVIHYAHAASLP